MWESEKKPNGPGKINGPTTRTKSGVCSWRFKERNPQEKLEDFDVKIGDYSLMRFGDANGQWTLMGSQSIQVWHVLWPKSFAKIFSPGGGGL